MHYLIGYAGRDVRCTEYAPFGSAELARLAFEGMRDRYAALRFPGSTVSASNESMR